MMVPNPAGGLPDTVARIVGKRLQERLGQPVVIENRPGANGRVAVAALLAAPADGYTLLVTDGAILTINPLLYANLAYNPKDILPIAMLARAPMFLAANPKVPAASLAELIAYAKAHPGQINYGSGGIASTHHLSMEAFAAGLKLDMKHVPFKGTGEAVPALLGGHIDLLFSAYPSLAGAAEGGQVELLATNGSERSKQAPNLPALSEVIPGFDLAPTHRHLRPRGHGAGGSRQAGCRGPGGTQGAGGDAAAGRGGRRGRRRRSRRVRRRAGGGGQAHGRRPSRPRASRLSRGNGARRRPGAAEGEGMPKLELSMAVGDYDRVRPLIDGTVAIDGVGARDHDAGAGGDLLPGVPPRRVRHRRAVAVELHGADSARRQSLRWGAGVPLARIPALRIYVRTDRGIDAPADLKGRKVGLAEYQLTANVWIRAFLDDDFGVTPASIRGCGAASRSRGGRKRSRSAVPRDVR